MVFSSILDDADTRLAIHNLKQSSFSYDVPGERGLAEISGYLHASSQITEATVKTWIFDGRIVGIEIRWTAIEPGKRGDWKQHAHIRAIFACCDGISSRRLEDWLDSSSDPVNRGGRPPKVPARAADGGTAADGDAPPPRAPAGREGGSGGANIVSSTVSTRHRKLLAVAA